MTKIKNDIFDKPPVKSSPDKYHKWINTEIINILPIIFSTKYFIYNFI